MLGDATTVWHGVHTTPQQLPVHGPSGYLIGLARRLLRLDGAHEKLYQLLRKRTFQPIQVRHLRQVTIRMGCSWGGVGIAFRLCAAGGCRRYRVRSTTVARIFILQPPELVRD